MLRQRNPFAASAAFHGTLPQTKREQHELEPLRIGAALLVAGIGMSACGHEVQTQEWYAEHLDEAEKRFNWCRQQIQRGKISRLGDSPESEDCHNAGQALMDAALKQGGQEVDRMLDDMRRQ